MLLLLPIMVLGARRPSFAELGRLAATVALALLANAFVCGVLANPHDRYGARLAWMAPLLVLLAVWQMCGQRQKAIAGVGDRPARLETSPGHI